MEPNYLIDFTIGTHAQNDVHAGTALSVQRLYPRGFKFFWDIRGAGGAARTRNVLATKFLKDAIAPYLIFIDRDIVFDPADIQNLLDDFKNNYDLIGGCYAVKDGTQLASYGLEDGSITLNRTIQEVWWLATGFTGVSQKLLRKMVDELQLPLMHEGHWSEAYPFFAQRPFHDGRSWIWLTEDYDFCQKARDVGVKSYIDTRIWVKHIGDRAWDVGDVIQHGIKNRLEESLNKVHQHLKQTLGTDLSDFLGESPENIIQKIADARGKNRTDWFARKGTTEDFYRNNKNYLYDLTQFNLQDEYWKTRMSRLTGIQGKKVLDIGCGIGTACFMLSEQGNEVLGYDINKTVIDFAEFRANRYDVKAKFTATMPQDLSQFDVVTAVDVLEHIEDLHSFLIELGRGMKRDARLFHFDAFWGQEESPMHFDHSTHINEYLAEAGFLAWNEVWAIKA